MIAVYLDKNNFLNLSKMAKIYPQISNSSSSSSSSLESETFTIWLKSLVLNGNGCTVYNSVGQIVYRVDNYDSKSSDEIYMMDLQGNATCSIIRKKFQMIGCWNGYKNDCPEMINEKPWFQIRKKSSTPKGILAYQATVGLNDGQENIYEIEGERNNKQSFKIIDEQRIVAEVKQKQSSGVVLGNDVLSLVIEPNVDQSLLVALTTFYGLIRKKN